ncbi:MAG: hypothetical protein Q8T09_17160 [Candidatus Melainabacteria bacterium]|nr:hypothetical protein [Candidatus Melainabacteria bacterium]
MEAKKTNSTDPDMENSMIALLRASKRARLLAAQTGTEFVVMRDGVLVREIPTLEDLEKTAGDSSSVS